MQPGPGALPPARRPCSPGSSPAAAPAPGRAVGGPPPAPPPPGAPPRPHSVRGSVFRYVGRPPFTQPLICLTLSPTPNKLPENLQPRHTPRRRPTADKRHGRGTPHTNQPRCPPTPSERSTGHVPGRGGTSESVLRRPREDSEVPRSRRGPFRPGRPRFCPSGGRASAAPPQPVRESAAARAPAPGPRLPRPSLSGGVAAAPRVSGGISGGSVPAALRPPGGTSPGVERREDVRPAWGCGACPCGTAASLGPGSGRPSGPEGSPGPERAAGTPSGCRPQCSAALGPESDGGRQRDPGVTGSIPQLPRPSLPPTGGGGC